MQEIEYSSNWQAALDRAGLRSFDDFFALSGELCTANKRRDVISFCIDKDERSQRLFIKRFRRPHLKDMVFAAQMAGQVSTQAQLEWRNARMLLKNKIETYHPVALGRETRLGLERRSFLITEEIRGISLADFVSTSWNKTTTADREQLMASLGRLARKLHDLGLSFPDLYVWHIFLIQGPDGGKDLALIDLHRMQHGVRTWHKRLDNLGALDYSMREEHFTPELKQILWESYLGSEFIMHKERLLAKIRSRSRTLRRRRRLPEY